MKIRKNDVIQILLGKDRGKTGKVLRVFSKGGKILVEGVNIYTRHVRRMGQQEGGEFNIGKPVDISNAALLCPKCKKAARVGFRLDKESKVRICKKCQEVI